MFTVFETNTTMIAGELMNNFYHCAQGDYLPLDTVNADIPLSPIGDTYNLGSSTAAWDTLHAKKIITDNIKGIGLWHKLVDYELEDTTFSFDLTGFDGDNEKEYLIIMNVKINAISPSLAIDVDAAGGWYMKGVQGVSDTTDYIESSGIQGNYNIGEEINYGERAVRYRFVVMQLQAFSGRFRPVMSYCLQDYNNEKIEAIEFRTGCITNSADNITEITIDSDTIGPVGALEPGTKIMIWDRRTR